MTRLVLIYNTNHKTITVETFGGRKAIILKPSLNHQTLRPAYFQIDLNVNIGYVLLMLSNAASYINQMLTTIAIFTVQVNTNMTKEEILELVLSLGSNHLEVFGGRYVGGKKIQQVPEEISEVIYTLLQLKPEIKNYAEIGSAGGGTTALLDEIFKLENAFIVDDNLHDDHKERPEILKDVKNVYEFIGDSQGAEAKKFVESFNIPLDMLFIDADHSYNGVKNDTFNYIGLVKSGGFIMYHDTVSYPGVKQHVEEMQQDSENYKLIINTGSKCGLALFQKL